MAQEYSLHIDPTQAQKQYKPKEILSMHPHKFMLWLFIVSSTMVFMAFTSAYIVRQSQGQWLEINLPVSFWYNTILIVASSVTAQLAYFATKKDRLKLVKILLLVTLGLGGAFLVGQWNSWSELVDMSVYFSGDADLAGSIAGSFIYVITGMHAAHIISAIIFMINMLISTLKYKVHSRSTVYLEMSVTWWHYLGGLWIYLLLFLELNR